MRCSNCKNRLVQKSETGARLRTKGPISFDADGNAKGNCYWCGNEAILPITLTKSLDSEPERLVLVEYLPKTGK